MAYSTVSLVLFFVPVVSAAPWPTDTPLCSVDCPITGSPKLSYETERTYLYSHFGKSQVLLHDVHDGITETSWMTDVHLTWLSPCDMAITIKNPIVDDSAGHPDASPIERYPLVVSMTDGHVQQVCSHPDEDTWSLNIKKGIASALQNSLPSLSPVNSGLNFTETDVVGDCPTKYKVEVQREKTVVTKEKNHQLCKNHIRTPSETPVAWLKASLPLEESGSECKQEITDNIYTKVTCKNRDVVRPSYGSYKYIEAYQESTLLLHSKDVDPPAAIGNLRGHLIQRSLLYDHETPKKNPSLVSHLEDVLKQICNKTQTSLENDIARLVSQAIHLMKQVPDEVIPQTLNKIRSVEICTNSTQLESLFLDAVAFVQEPGAVKVMVDELLNEERLPNGRHTLYISAFYLTPRPSLQAVESIKDLLTGPNFLPQASLAGASMVNTYCRLNPQCEHALPIVQILQFLGDNIEQECAFTSDEDQQQAAMAHLKTLGNIGVINNHYARTLIRCMERIEGNINVRIAAAQAFRNTKCLREPTSQLSSIAVDPNLETEVRIASYLESIRCAEEEDLNMMIEKITKETNTQVRSFILSHLLTIQKSKSHEKRKLREMLSDILLPTNFTMDNRKYSSNNDLAYYSPFLDAGIGIESNIVYATASYIARAIDLNMTTVIRDTPLNLGEFGARIRGLEPFLENLFGPNGYFRNKTYEEIVRDINLFSRQKGQKIVDEFKYAIRKRRSIDVSTILSFLEKLYEGTTAKVPQLDMFARFMGQEIFYSSIKGNFYDIDIDKLIEDFFNTIGDTIEDMSEMAIRKTRAAQFRLDYSIPSIQGVPLKLELEGTAIADLEINGNFDLINLLYPTRKKEASLSITPSMSVNLKAFVGYDSYIARKGLIFKGNCNNAQGVSFSINMTSDGELDLGLDFPEKAELINIESDTYLVKAIRGKPEIKIIPSSIRDIRVQHHSCYPYFENAVGLKMCYEINVPNVFLSTGLPLGQKSFMKFYVEKTESSRGGYQVKARINNTQNHKMVRILLRLCGTSMMKEAEVFLSYRKEPDSHKISASVDYPGVSSGFRVQTKKQDQESEVEVVAEYKIEDADLARKMKISITTSSDSSDKVTNIKVYVSPNIDITPNSLVAEWKYIKRSHGMISNFDVTAKTFNMLRHYMDINIESSTEVTFLPYMIIPFAINQRKFEFHIALQGWEMTSFVRKTMESTYKSAFQLKQRGYEIIALESTLTFSGRLEQSFTIKTATTARLKGKTYKASLDILNEASKQSIVANVIDPAVKQKILELETTFGRTAETTSSKLLVDIPHYMQPIQLDSKFTNAKDSILIQTVLNHGKHILLEMNGPVSFAVSLMLLSLDADLTVTTLTTGPYNVNLSIQFSQITQLISVDVIDRKTRIVAIKWNVDAEHTEETVYGVELHIPTITNNEFYMIFSKDHISIILDNLMFPQTPSPRRVKGLADLNIAKQTLKADFAWDADRFPNKKLSLNLALLINPSNPEQGILNGYINVMAKRYHIQLTGNAEDDEDSSSMLRAIDFTLTTPTRKTFNIQLEFILEHHTSYVKMGTSIMLKNLDQKQYQGSGMVSFQDLHSPLSYRVITETMYVAPNGHMAKFYTEAKHMVEHASRIIYLKVKAINHAVQKPLMVEIKVQNDAHSSKMDFVTETDKRASILTWDLQSYVDGGVRNINTIIKLPPAVELLKVIRKMAHSGLLLTDNSFVGIASSEDSMTYHCRYYRPSASSHAVSLKFPSRTMEGEFTISPSEYLLKFYPNRERSDSKYEIASTFERHLDQGNFQWQNRISHPSLHRDMELNVLYQNTDSGIKGTMEVDIYPDLADKVIGTIESFQITHNSYLIKTIITSRVLMDNSSLTVFTAYAPNSVGLDVVVQPTVDSEPVFEVSCKYEQTSGHNAAFAFIMKSEGQLSADLSGSIKPVDRPDCDGFIVAILSEVPVMGRHELHTEACKSSYVKVTGIAQGKVNHTYRAAVGLQKPNNFEISLYSTKEPSGAEPIILVQSILQSPNYIDFDLAYRHQEFYRILNSVHDEITVINAAVKSWVVKVYQYLKQQAKQKKIHFPPQKVVTLYTEAKQEVEAIYQDLVLDGLIVEYETLIRFLRSPTVNFIRDRLKWAWSHIIWLERNMKNHLVLEFSAWEREFRELIDSVVEGTKEITDLIKEGTIPKKIKDIWKTLEHTFIAQAIREELETFATSYPEEFQGFQHIISKTRITVLTDLTQQRKKYLNMASTQKFFNWITHNAGHWTELEAGTLAFHTIQKLTFFSVESGNNSLKVSIPLSNAVYSLSQAMQKTSPLDLFRNIVMSYYVYIPSPLNDFLWSYYTLFPDRVSDLVPPFNRTAMVVGDTEILTFDGTLLQVPRSECEILLASYLLNELTMAFPEEEKPSQFTMTVSGTTAVVKPDRRVTINGQPITEHYKSEGSISVAVTFLEVQVISPFLTLHVSRTSRTAALVISGWSFGRVAGLLGTYDGEVGNDWMMPSGAMATSMQQLVSSWQENQQCETPNIPTVHPSFARFVRCNAMLNIRSRCSAIINPDLFIDMCYAGHDPCDAARAYRTLCSEKGVLSLVPMGC